MAIVTKGSVSSDVTLVLASVSVALVLGLTAVALDRTPQNCFVRCRCFDVLVRSIHDT